MKHTSLLVLGAGLVLAGGAIADDNPASVKQGIGKGPAVQQSVPSSAPAPTATQHTGATNQSGAVKSMNKEAQKKVETEGK